jgi:hypothetical protein
VSDGFQNLNRHFGCDCGVSYGFIAKRTILRQQAANFLRMKDGHVSDLQF